jgi:hypothetical protein
MPLNSSKDVRRKTSETTKGFVYEFNWLDMIIGIGAIIVYFVDIVTDVKLAVDYFIQQDWFYASVTTALIVGPSFVTCCFGLHWYHIDYRSEQRVVAEHLKRGHQLPRTPRRYWFLRIFFTLLQFGPVVR